MIQVIIGTNLSRKTITVDPSKTIKSVLEENDIDYSRGGVHLDGLAIAGADINKTFTDHNITERCILVSVVKADGGLK